MKRLFVVICIAYRITDIWTIDDYCHFKHCYGNTKHIACGHNGKFDTECPKDARLFDINKSLQKLLIDGHNEKRNIIAGGGGKNLTAACRMATMQWDEELASYATLNVKKCKADHDNCHNTDKFHYSGQNLVLISYFEPIDIEARLNQAMQMWYDEVSLTKQEYIDSLPEVKPIVDKIGHFTALVTDRNIRLGCAASIFSLKVPIGVPPHMGILLVCNYAAANLPNFFVYEKCDKPAKNCKTGTNPEYPNLCSLKEKFDYNYGFE